MKKLKINSITTKIAALMIVAASFIVACSKTDDNTPADNSGSGATSEKVISGPVKSPVNQPDAPLILGSLSLAGCCCSHGTSEVTVTLNSLTCSYYVTGGSPGYLWYTWYTGPGCGVGQISTTSKSICSPVFCLTKGATYYLRISTGSSGSGSSSPCYSIVVP